MSAGLAGHRSTGDPRLDDLLGGGLPRRALSLVVGGPGVGKTLLGQRLARLAGEAATWFTCLTTPPAALERWFGAPQPPTVDLSDALLAGDLPGALDQLRRTLLHEPGGLAIIDDLDGLLADDDHHRRRWLYQVLLVLEQADTAGVALAATPWASPAAALVLRLDLPAAGPSQVQVLKSLGTAAGSPVEYRLGAQGFSLAGAAAQRPTVPVSALGARLLQVFRTSRRATLDELALVTGHDAALLTSALDGLVATGYLQLESGEGSAAVYGLPAD